MAFFSGLNMETVINNNGTFLGVPHTHGLLGRVCSLVGRFCQITRKRHSFPSLLALLSLKGIFIIICVVFQSTLARGEAQRREGGILGGGSRGRVYHTYFKGPVCMPPLSPPPVLFRAWRTWNQDKMMGNGLVSA